MFRKTLIAASAVAIVTLSGMSWSNTAEAARWVAPRRGRVITRNYNQARREFRQAGRQFNRYDRRYDQYFNNRVYRSPNFYRGYRGYRGYGNGYISTPYFSIGF